MIRRFAFATTLVAGHVGVTQYVAPDDVIEWDGSPWVRLVRKGRDGVVTERRVPTGHVILGEELPTDGAFAFGCVGCGEHGTRSQPVFDPDCEACQMNALRMPLTEEQEAEAVERLDFTLREPSRQKPRKKR